MDSKAARKAKKRQVRAKIRSSKKEARSQRRLLEARAREQQEARELELDRRARELVIASKSDDVQPQSTNQPTTEPEQQARAPVFNRRSWQKVKNNNQVTQKQEASGFNKARWNRNGLDKH